LRGYVQTVLPGFNWPPLAPLMYTSPDVHLVWELGLSHHTVDYDPFFRSQFASRN